MLWKTQWKLLNMKLLKKWEKMENLTHKYTLELSMIMLKSKGKMWSQDHSQQLLIKLNIPNKLLRKIWFIRLLINSTAPRCHKKKTCQQNTSHVQNLSLELSMEETLSTLDWIPSKPQVDSMRPKINEQILLAIEFAKIIVHLKLNFKYFRTF